MSRPCSASSRPSSARRSRAPTTDPRFWASGISLIAHHWNPHVPAVHMNTRFVVTTKAWFGGGADLTPVLDRAPHPGRSRHARPSTPRCRRPATRMRRSRPTRSTRPGATSISFSSTATSRAASAASSTTGSIRATGTPTSPSRRTSAARSSNIYPALVRRNFATPWTEAERDEQLVRRGRYVEFNLLYDRGTMFGLQDRRQCRFDPVVDAAGGEMAR